MRIRIIHGLCFALGTVLGAYASWLCVLGSMGRLDAVGRVPFGRDVGRFALLLLIWGELWHVGVLGIARADRHVYRVSEWYPWSLALGLLVGIASTLPIFAGATRLQAFAAKSPELWSIIAYLYGGYLLALPLASCMLGRQLLLRRIDRGTSS
jgi:hypothetical protein